MHPHSDAERVRVLLYIGQPEVTCRLTELLTSHNMAVTTAYTAADLQEATRIGGLDVGTTNTAGIESTRQGYISTCRKRRRLRIFPAKATGRPEAIDLV